MKLGAVTAIFSEWHKLNISVYYKFFVQLGHSLVQEMPTKF